MPLWLALIDVVIAVVMLWVVPFPPTATTVALVGSTAAAAAVAVATLEKLAVAVCFCNSGV